MPQVRMQNTIGSRQSFNNKNNRRSDKPRRVSYKNDGFINRLKNLFPFKINTSGKNLFLLILIYLLRFFTFVFFSLYFLITIIFEIIANLCKNSIIARNIVIVLGILIVFGIIDFGLNYGKIYPGVHVNDIDLGCKTIEDAEKIINDELSKRISSNQVIIYGNEESKDFGQNYEGAEINEQLSLRDAHNSIIYWELDSSDLEANLPTKEIVTKAADETRGLNNIFKRLGALFFTYNIAPYAEYNSDSINIQVQKINDTLGSPVINPTCNIINGVASPVDGNNGFLLNKQVFENQLNDAIFKPNKNESNFIPELNDAPTSVSFDAAKKLSEIINAKLNNPVVFNYKNNKWNAPKEVVGTWIDIQIKTEKEEKNVGCSCNSYYEDVNSIYAKINNDSAGTDIITNTNIADAKSLEYSLKFENINNETTVKTDGNFEVPNVNDACDKLNNMMLGDAVVFDRSDINNNVSSNNETFNVNVEPSNVASSLSLNQALNIGLVQKIASYTTSYTSGSGTENRNNNIKVAAETINKSICCSNGGSWSFLDIVGDTTADKGYTEAGTVLGNRYSKSSGGGVCQVATTIFNAVYESGFEVIERYNHSLYISSYPEGRDAAIAYPDMDLVWKNDTNSDVLMLAECSGHSLTVTLLGVDPQYSVKSEVGQWTEGENYTQNYVVDPSKQPNSKFTQTTGTNGKSITVKRIVTDREGAVIREKEFRSNYKPKNEVIVLGPGDEANQLLAQKNARMKDETDPW